METLTMTIPGGQVPRGHIKISGAKNAATRLLAAALLTDEKVTLTNFPTELVDARVKIGFMRAAGAKVDVDGQEETVDVRADGLSTAFLPAYDYPIRTTYLLAAGQLRKSGTARVPYPGGCKIGSRGYDLHIMVWEAFGCRVEEQAEFIEVSCAGRLRPAVVDFPISTVGGTENALLCASLVAEQSEIRNAYVTPEVSNLIELLRRFGVEIEVVGNSLIKVCGADNLRGARINVLPDRIEALTWIVYGIISGGEILIDEVPFNEMEIPLIHLEKAGVDLFRNSQSVYVSPACLRAGQIQPFEIACGTHPGVISDMQPFFVTLALCARGRSRIVDYRYPNRTHYLKELAKICPEAVTWTPGDIQVQGPAGFHGNDASSTDLRGSMAVVMAGLCAEGTTTVRNVSMALRGYNNLVKKLASLGVTVYVGS